jgi:hypothetical protein
MRCSSPPAGTGIGCQAGGGDPASWPCCVAVAPQSHRYMAQMYGYGASIVANSTLMSGIVARSWRVMQGR